MSDLDELVAVGESAPANGLMHVVAHVWPLAADDAGIWLLSGGGPWQSLPVPADSEPHEAAELELMTHQALAETVVLHSSGWLIEGNAVVTTYFAIVDCPGEPAKAHWPQAEPVSPGLARLMGPPPTHGATEAPAPPFWHVLQHAVRHVAYLRDRDATVAAKLTPAWRRHLAEWQPEIARMYDRVHAEA